MSTIITDRVVTTSVQLECDSGTLKLSDLQRFVDECEDEAIPGFSEVTVGRECTWIRAQFTSGD
ncbi:hypothetical protein SEA_LOZINAK_100 [Gordonia phage Lozinak]|uniref:Uncharacterized protein n=3 Tax=Smoothievirus TaxID=1982557 RepID=A0A2D1GG18_9CAUD|nr:hypothetical protein BEN60_gp106 [Gordonia phage Smoothie]YP_009276213.1 hypothetical protein BH772_gp109 [Gordonia phage Bachita]YP_009281255.1 hypothetical protein BIZ74_gp104 [Gordonia phage Cucurbita]ATN90726.1 hypothetical protein SEA_LOZINAK_100 [Gordonia phage Lozinak]QKY79677.1 hypothetical protein SEA_ENGINEER_101 [Gordonia Phage Engineer]WKW85898.1 hypothetical protein SEA_PHINKBODEN_99 [Gordonia Phage PhinkBoden]ANA86257.1 hypothetical protein PBI_SMOOTHIE_101 [Gordonia phage Sm